jgi:asparagine synthase (glutamine-hydrolysing)
MKRGIVAFMGSGSWRARVRAAAGRFALREVAGPEGLLLCAGAALPSRILPDGSTLLGDIFALSGGTCTGAGDGWGNFLSFAADGETLRIARAPITGLPLYWTRYGDGILFASHLHLVADLLAGGTIDWAFVAQSLSYINMRTERTGLGGLLELLPGSRFEYDGRTVRIASTWSPWDHVMASLPPDVGELARSLEQRLIACHRAWSGSRRDILLELSGGLDSSIVAAALAGSGAGFSAINFVTPRGDGDERIYAHMVAAHCGADLIEAELGGEDIDLIAPPAMRQPRPAEYGILNGIDAAFGKAAPASDAAIFSGIGGDNIFGFDNSVAPIFDAWQSFGFSRRSFTALSDVARAADTTLWNALALVRRARRNGRRRGWRRETLFLSPAAVPEAPLPHPWDDGADDVGPGKRNHVEALRRILDFMDRPGRWHDRDVVAPLLSQPVVELCLSIPSWTWMNGGRDRAIARAAFARRLPSETVWRRGKGRIESVLVPAYLGQRSRLRDLLLGGRLAAAGLIDSEAIEHYLGRDLALGDFAYYRLLEIADVERWVRSIEGASFFGPNNLQRLYCADFAGSGSTSSFSQ